MNIPDDFLQGEVRDGFYVENMMKRAWAAQMEVLKDVDVFCKKHNITYYAEWGTLLGAIRHKGFIPWDDDIDISMKREDYNKFCILASKEMEGYDIINNSTRPWWDEIFSRIVYGDCVRTDKEYLDKFHGFPYVVGLDIFPLDYVSSTSEETKLQCDIIAIILAFANNIGKNIATEEEIECTTKQIEEMCAIKFKDGVDLVTQLYDLAEKLCMIGDSESSDSLVFMCDYAVHHKLKPFPKECYDETIEVPFEYMSIPIPKGYDKILRIEYGDNYMQPILSHDEHEYPFYNKQKKELYARAGIEI